MMKQVVEMMTPKISIFSRPSLVAMLLGLVVPASNAAEKIDVWPVGSELGKVEDAADKPTLAVMLPPREDGDSDPIPAVLLCPGGGYKHHSSYGPYWPFFRDRGVAVFYLKYRLPVKGYVHPAPLLDAQRAMGIIRANATKWNIDPKRVGVMGFSSGGHLASTLSTHYHRGKAGSDDPVEAVSCRPDFAVLYSAVITMKEHAHTPSVVRLLGKDASPERLDELSNELQVDAQTPPTYLGHAADDKLVLVQNSKKYFAALQKAGVVSELKVYPTGGHGGIQSQNPKWDEELDAWLRGIGVLERKVASDEK